MQVAKKIAPFFLFIFAVAAGFFTRPVSGEIQQSSLYDISVTSWDELSCLSENENIKLYQTLHLKAKVNPADCKSEIDGRFNKALAFLTKNQLPIATEAFGDVTELIRDPITFISENVPELDFDLRQSNSIAYNAMQRAVYLGQDFFRLDPYVSIAVLLHEAWHSVKTDPGHERCATGDIAQTKGGCDQVFTLQGNMIGGYSVTFAYLAAHGLYNQALSAEKRQILIEEALTLMGSRFNSGVQKYASVVESLVVLDHNGDLQLVHPLLNKTHTLARRTASFAPRKLGYQQSNGGALIFTEDMHVYEWDTFRPIQRFYSQYVGDDKKVVDAARLFIALDDYTYNGFLLDNEMIYKVVSSGNDWSLVPAVNGAQPISPIQIATYYLFSAGYLSKDGEVYRFGLSTRGRSKPFIKDETLEQTGIRFRYITGGVNTDSFWGISQNGDVYRMVANDMIQLTKVPQERFKKIQATHLGVYLLSENGKVYYNDLNSVGIADFRQLAVNDVQDFSVTKRLVPQNKTFDDLPESNTGCAGKPIATDPYFPDHYWSLDQGRLYFGDAKSCTWVADQVKTFYFNHAPSQDFSEYKAILRKEDGAKEVRIWTNFPFR